MKRLIAIVLTTLTLIGAACATGCDSETPTKEYSKSGLTVTLPTDFVEKDIVTYTYTLQSADVIMTAVKEEFSLFEALGIDTDEVTLVDYASLVVETNGLPSDTKISESNGLTTFTYQNDANGKTYFYYASVFKGSDAFWLVQFGCDANNKDKFQSTFVDYTKTVVVE